MDPSWTNTILNGLMVLVWVAYLNLFLGQVRGHFRARIFIQLHGSYDLDAQCMLINMSDKPISILCVQLYLQQGDGDWIVDITGSQMRPRMDGVQPIPGALKSAETVGLGTFRDLLCTAARIETGRQDPPEELPDDLEKFDVRLVVQHGASDHPGAVERTFAVERHPERWVVIPDGATRLRYSRRGRRLAQEWMRMDVELRGSHSTKAAGTSAVQDRTRERRGRAGG